MKNGYKMRNNLFLKGFLIENSYFNFNLLNFIQSAGEVDNLSNEFQDFISYFERCKMEQIWRLHKKEILKVSSKIKAYNKISLVQKDFWSNISILRKNDLLLNFNDFLNPEFKRNQLFERSTSGTSGKPITVLWSSSFFFDFQLYTPARVAYISNHLNDDLKSKDIFCMSLVGNTKSTDRVWSHPKGFTGLHVNFITSKRRDMSWFKILNLFFKKYGIGFLSMTPHMLDYLLRNIKLENNREYINQFKKISFIVTGGSTLRSSLRKEAEELFEKPVYSFYGLSEVGPIGSECRYQNGFHIYDTDIILEVKKKDGSIGLTGKGTLLASSFRNKAMPLLRYYTGDTGEITNEVCACGKFGRRILDLSERIIPTFKLSSGKEFSPTKFKYLCKIFPLSEFRITQEKINVIKVEVEIEGQVNKGKLYKEIEAYFKKELREHVFVKVFENEFKEMEKFQRYRSLI